MEPVSASAMKQRFDKHLELLGRHLGASMQEGDVRETLHGIRAGGALSMALQGHPLKDIMLQGFWRSPETALHYIGLLQEVIGAEFMAALDGHPGLRGRLGGGTKPQL